MRCSRSRRVASFPVVYRHQHQQAATKSKSIRASGEALLLLRLEASPAAPCWRCDVMLWTLCFSFFLSFFCPFLLPPPRARPAASSAPLLSYKSCPRRPPSFPISPNPLHSLFHSPSPPLPIWPTHLISYVEKRYSVGKKVTRPEQSRPAASLGPALPLPSSPLLSSRHRPPDHPSGPEIHPSHIPTFLPSFHPSFLPTSKAKQREIQHSTADK